MPNYTLFHDSLNKKVLCNQKSTSFYKVEVLIVLVIPALVAYSFVTYLFENLLSKNVQLICCS